MSSQPLDPSKPDLEESTNVAQQHASVSRAASAASREQKLTENGLEPISIWLFIIGSIVAMLAGSILFQGNDLFGYDTFVKSGYVEGVDPAGGKVAVPQGAVEEIYLANGKGIYKTTCLGCHGSDGGGSAAFPPLGGSKWVQESPFIPALAMAHGVTGEIIVNGKTFASVMPPQGGLDMSDFDLASMVYFVQNSFGNKVGKIYTLDQAKQMKEAMKAHTSGMTTAADLEKFKGKQVTGDFFAAGTIINKKTGEVIEAKK